MTLLEATEVQIEYADVSFAHYLRIFKHLSKLVKRHLERSDGLHVSDIIKYAYFGSLPEGAERLKKEREAAEDLGDYRVFPLMMFLGMAWELWVSGLYPEMTWQPGEFSHDGISGSPDGITQEKDRLILDEFKFTFKSSRNREILRETLWMWQLAAYAKLLNTRYARLHVCWINGNYSHGEEWGPRYYKYLIQFQPHELQRTWDSVFLRNREKALELKELSGV